MPLSHRSFPLLVAGVALASLSLSGCTDFRRAVGWDKVIPDEFAVVSRAPLAIPPDYTLRPPRLGAPRAQETAPVEQARQTVFRAAHDEQAALPPAAGTRSPAEGELLQKAGAADAPANIRELVNRDVAETQPVDESFVDKLLFWRGGSEKAGDAGQLVDPEKEAQRLREAKASGKSPAADAGAAPVIERTHTPSLFERLF
jgi:hypothetical protein